jgi:Spy/CpxP family protein refolding chaperone
VKSAKLKGGLVLVGVFVLGTLAGGAATRAWMQRDYAEQLSGHAGERLARRHLRALERELDLTDEQRQRVREIIEKYRPEGETVMNTLAESCGAPLREHKAKVDAEIRAVLNPEQQKRFDALLEKQRERFPLVGPPPFGRHGGARVRGARGDGPPHGRPGGRRAGDPTGAVSAPDRSGRPGMMRRLDRDGDHKLSQDDVSPETWSRISAADADGDGFVTRDELRQHRQAHRP